MSKSVSSASASYFTVSRQEMEYMWVLYNRESLFHMSKQMIIGKLMANGFSFSRKLKVFTPDPSIMDSFNIHWRSFVADAIDSILCFGFLVVYFPKDSLKRKYPAVLDYKKYKLSCNNGKFELETEENTNATLYMDFGYVPLRDGSLTSIVSKLRSKSIFVEAHVLPQGSRTTRPLAQGNN